MSYNRPAIRAVCKACVQRGSKEMHTTFPCGPQEAQHLKVSHAPVSLYPCCMSALRRQVSMATRNPSLNIVPSLKRNQTEVEAAAADAELRGARGDWWWTGPKPTACPGFDEEAGVLRYVKAVVLGCG